jgi:serine/threonine protein kinase
MFTGRPAFTKFFGEGPDQEKFPFESEEETYEFWKRYELLDKKYENFRNLMLNMLNKQPHLRPTLGEIISHPFLIGESEPCLEREVKY